MSAGQHGLQPEGHEHVHCRFCNANGVHVQPPTNPHMAALGKVAYGPHEVKGGIVPCAKSAGHLVWDAHRHQGDPLVP